MGLVISEGIYGTNDINLTKLMDNHKIIAGHYLVLNEDYNYKSKIVKKYLKYFDDLKLPAKKQKLSKSEKVIYQLIVFLSKKASTYVIPDIIKYLDLNNLNNLFKLLNDLAREKAIIIVSDDINLIYERCEKVFLFNNRHLLYYGSTLKVFNSKKYLEDVNFVNPCIANIRYLALLKNIYLLERRDYKDVIKDIYKHVKKD